MDRQFANDIEWNINQFISVGISFVVICLGAFVITWGLCRLIDRLTSRKEKNSD